MKNIINILYKYLIVGLIFTLSSTPVFANDFTSNHITLQNAEQETVSKGYPVIIATNNTNIDLDVTYDFYIDKEGLQPVDRVVSIPANESILIEIPELSLLGKTQATRTVWFSWSERGRMKPLGTQITTHPFKTPNGSDSSSDAELG